MRANFAAFANALCHLNATPLSVVLAPCAWSENLACGVAWQSVVNSAKRNTAWRGEFDNETVQQSKHSKFGLASVVKMWQCLRVKLAKQKWGGVWAGDFSLSLSLSRCSHFLHAFALNLKSFFTHFIVVLTHLFAYKRDFLGHCVFLKFSNALFFGFLRLSLQAIFVKIV